jgi:cytosine/adenosine deaminase-related metal-dependent hydrolase
MSHAETLDRLLTTTGDGDRRILLRDATVLSMDPAVGDFARADILIEGGRISAIGPDLDVAEGSAVVVDAEGHVAIPGLHDTHRHSWQTQFRRMFVDIDLGDYVEILHQKIAPCYRPVDSHIGNLMAGLGALDSGITCVMDFSHNTRSADHADSCVEGWKEAGIRAVHASCGAALGDWDHQWPGDLERLQAKHFSSADQLVTLRIGLLAPLFPGVAENLQLTREHLELARGLGLKTSVDAVFGGPASERVVELGRAGVLGDDITYIHCQDLEDEAWKHIVDSGGHLSLAPTSDANLGQMSSITPIQKALDLGLTPSLGCDVECSLTTDLFAQMQAVLTIQRLFAYNRRHNGDEHAPPPVPARDVLKFATVAGATANGLIDQVGTLTPGKQADIVLIDAMNIRAMPLNNAVGSVVMGSDSASVRAVFVAGEVRKFDGQLVGVDVAAVRKRVVESRDRLLAEAGVELELLA